MKKVLLAKGTEHLFGKKDGFIGRSDIRVFTAATNDELLKIHRKEKVDLIVTLLDLPGIRSEELFSLIRSSSELRDVSTVIICEDTLAHRERCGRCRANAVFPIPVETPLLYIRMHQFLGIEPRKSYRAALAVGIQGTFRDLPRPFWTVNISASGMLIRSEEPLARGDGAFFSFFLPDGTHVSGYGEIIRAERQEISPETYLYGIKFTNIDPAAKAAIAVAVVKKEHS